MAQSQTVTTQDQVMKTQANRYVGPYMKPNGKSMISRLRDFTRMNPPEFLGSKVEEDPQRYIDEVSKVLHAIEVSSKKKEEPDAYQLKGVSSLE